MASERLVGEFNGKKLIECRDCKSTTFVIDTDNYEVICAVCGTICGIMKTDIAKPTFSS